MTNEQLYLAIGVPILFNAVLITVLVIFMNRQNDSLRTDANRQNDGLRSEMRAGFAAINQRFDDMRDLWRAELHRVEEVLDARLKHIETERKPS